MFTDSKAEALELRSSDFKKKIESTTGVIIFSRGKFTESSRHLAAIALMQYHDNNMNITCVLAE